MNEKTFLLSLEIVWPEDIDCVQNVVCIQLHGFLITAG